MQSVAVMAALFAFWRIVIINRRGIFCSLIHLDEPQMNDVKLRHDDEPQMNSSMNAECQIVPINWAFHALRVLSVTL